MRPNPERVGSNWSGPGGSWSTNAPVVGGMSVAGWVIWYGDGTRREGKTAGQWDEAPERDVQVVAYLCPRGRATFSSAHDAYAYPGGLEKLGSWIEFDRHVAIAKAAHDWETKRWR